MKTAPKDATASQLRLLASRRFLPLFAVQFLNAFNDQMFKTAFLALLTWEIAAEQGLQGGLDLMNQLAAALFILPFALFAPTAGQIADGMDKARMMRLVLLSDVAIMALGALAFLLRDVTLLLAVLALTGIQSAFFAPVKYAVLPRYLARAELVAGNGLVLAGTFLAIILGQIAGAKIVLTAGGEGIVAALLLALSAAGWAAARFALPVPPLGPAPAVDWVLPRAALGAVRRCFRHGEAAFAIVAGTWFWFTGSAILSFLPPLALESFRATEDVALLLLVTFSLGIGLGALLCNAVLRGRITYGPAPFGALGILAGLLLFHAGQAEYASSFAAGEPAALLSAAEFLARPGAAAVLAGFLIVAVSAGLYIVPLTVVYQATSPESERARFVAASGVLDSVAMVVSALLCIGLVAAGLSREGVMLLFGLSGLPVALALFLHHRSGPDLSPRPIG